MLQIITIKTLRYDTGSPPLTLFFETLTKPCKQKTLLLEEWFSTNSKVWPALTGQFSHPLGIGGYWSYSGWQIFEMAIILKEWQYSEWMTKIRKEWQYQFYMFHSFYAFQLFANENPQGRKLSVKKNNSALLSINCLP